MIAEPAETAARPTASARAGARRFVLIDAYNIEMERGTGVATYARNLSRALHEAGNEVGVLYGAPISEHQPDLLKEVIFYDADLAANRIRSSTLGRIRAILRSRTSKAFAVPINGTVIPDAFKTRLPCYDSIWNVRDLYFSANARFNLLGLIHRVTPRRRPDIVHWTYPLPLRVPGAPNIYTIHDLVPLRLPFTTLDIKSNYWKLLKWIARTADHVVTVSENSRRDIIDILGIPPSRVTNTYQAVAIPDEYRLKPDSEVRREVEGVFGLEHRGYFLFFGSIEPKKNIHRLLEGYFGSGARSPLVILGARAWKADQELSLLKLDEMRARTLGGGAGRVIRLDYAPFGLLVSLIRGAKAVLFPSLYEGFGLPILESMLLGTPVLTSNTSSVPEVAGNAALCVNPYHVNEIAQGIRALDGNGELRAELAARGLQRAKLFDLSTYQAKLEDVYREVEEAHAK